MQLLPCVHFNDQNEWFIDALRKFPDWPCEVVFGCKDVRHLPLHDGMALLVPMDPHGRMDAGFAAAVDRDVFPAIGVKVREVMRTAMHPLPLGSAVSVLTGTNACVLAVPTAYRGCNDPDATVERDLEAALGLFAKLQRTTLPYLHTLVCPAMGASRSGWTPQRGAAVMHHALQKVARDGLPADALEAAPLAFVGRRG